MLSNLSHTHKHACMHNTHIRPPSVGHFDVSTYLQTKHKIRFQFFMPLKNATYTKAQTTHPPTNNTYTHTHPHAGIHTYTHTLLERPLISECK